MNSDKTDFMEVLPIGKLISQQAKEELLKERTVKETVQFITPSMLEKAAVVALCLLSVFPLLCAIADHFLRSGLLSLYRSNSCVGFIGLVFGLLILLRDYFQPEKPLLRERLRGKGLSIFLTLMLMWSILSCIFSTNPIRSLLGDQYRLDGLVSYFAYAGISIFATQIRTNASWRTVLNFFTTIASIIALLCLLNIGVINAFLNIYPDKAIFFNVNHHGYYLCMAIPAVTSLFIADSKRRKYLHMLWYLVELAVLTAVLFNAHSLGPFLAVVGSFAGLVVLGFFVDRSRFKRILLALAVFAVMAGIPYAGKWDVKKDIIQTSNEISIMPENIGQPVSEEFYHIGSDRGILWANAVRFVKERPLFGYGPDNLGDVYAQAGCKNDRPHCEPLQFAASLGIPAAVFYLAGLFCLLSEFIRKFRNLNIDVLCAFCVVGSYLISSLVGNTMFYTSPFFFMMLGMAYGLIKAVPEKSGSKQAPASGC